MKKQVINCKNFRYFATLGQDMLAKAYPGKYFGNTFDLGICTTSRGRLLTTWGLNASQADLNPDVNYVYASVVSNGVTTRKNYEAIISELS